MKNLLMAMFVLLFLGSVVSSISVAGEEIDTEFSYGIVVEISDGVLTLEEYDVDADESNEVIYEIDSEVELVGADSLEDITVGDSVEVEYILGDDEKGKVVYIKKVTDEE